MILTCCPACRASVREGERFCEACGHPLASPALVSSAPARADPGAAPSNGAAGNGCAHCGAPAEEITEDEYCERCGMRQPRRGDHRESDFGRFAAAVTDRGLRHFRNEDAYEIAGTGEQIVAVVCDGVSNSTTPELASAAAATAALRALSPVLQSPALDHETAEVLLNEAITRAQLAVAGLGDGGGLQAPATTIVAAIVTPNLVALANVGDSRAYWLAGNSDELSQPLTVDDSCAQESIATGVDPVLAHSAENAHTLTRWLGADAGEIDPRITIRADPRDGTVLLCSDGLWNHFPQSVQLRDLLTGDGDPRPIAVARRMVAAALSAGGEDNITAIVIPAPPAPQPEARIWGP